MKLRRLWTILVTFLGLTGASAHAIEIFEIGFHLTNEGTPEITFPDGYPPEGLMTFRPFYRFLDVTAKTRIEFRDDFVIRCKFLEPMKVRTQREGKVSVVLFRYLDVRLDAADWGIIKALKEREPERLFVTPAYRAGKMMSVQDVIDFQKTSGSLLPLAEYKVEMPELLAYIGDEIGVGHISFEDFKKGLPMERKLGKVTLRRVLSFDRFHWKMMVSGDQYLITADRTLDYEGLNVLDEKANQFLEIQSKVFALRSQVMGAEFITWTDAEGKEQVVVKKPVPEDNVIKADFGRKKKSCPGSLEED